MNCVITGTHIKVFGKVIHCLAKFGNELTVCDSDEGLSLKTVNNARSAYASVILKENFFNEYERSVTDVIQDSGNSGFICKITMKVILGVFKSVTAIEKSVDKCHLIADEDGSKLTIRFDCKLDIIKTYDLHCMETEILSTVYSKDSCVNRLSLPIKLVGDIFLAFTNKQIEINLIANQDFIVIENRVDEDIKNKDAHNQMHTRLKLSSDEFESYNIGDDETSITFCLKELKGILQFSEFDDLSVQIFFSSPGRPVIFCTAIDDNLEIDLVLATLESTPLSSLESENMSQFELRQSTNNQTNSSRPKKQRTSTVTRPAIASTSKERIKIDIERKRKEFNENDEPVAIAGTPTTREKVFSIFDTPTTPPYSSSQFETLASDTD